jgi:UDP-glucose 6-dehydrogenase
VLGAVRAAGHSVVAVDVFPSYVHAINSKQLVSHEPHVAEMLAAATRLRATTSVAEAATAARMLFIFVQTPSSGGDRHYDHSHLSDVLGQLNALRVQDKHIVICW